MIDTTSLNPQQLEAAKHGKGPCLVLATAGSGKTRVLTIRAGLLIESGVSPERILLATFTKKAAEEMRKRLAAMIGEEQAQPVWIGTFHSHCLRILRISYAMLGIHTFEVLPPGRAIWVAKDILAPQDAKHPYGMDWQTDPKAALSRISRAKADLVDVNGAIPYFMERTNLDDSISEQVEFWRRYEALKEEQNLLDFDDFLLKTYQLFRSNPEMLSHWQSQFDWVLEDEVQDTIIAQHEIVRLLAVKHHNYFAVGDVNQSVYGFRGSNPDHTVMSFQRDYPEGKIIKLPMNYRSQAGIVDCGSRLIKHNAVSPAYTLQPTSNRNFGGDPEVWVSGSEDSEAERIAIGLLDQIFDKYAYKDIAILYRVNAQSRALEDAMTRHNIPYVVYGSSGFYDRKEVKDLLSYLQLAHNPNCEAGDEALKRVINIASTWFRLGFEQKHTHFLGAKFITQLENTARKCRSSLWQALDYGSWTGWQLDSITDFKDLIEVINQAGPEPAAMLAAVRENCYDAYLKREEGNDEDENDGTRAENLDELISASEQYENVSAFLDFITQQRSRAKNLAKDQDAVQLLTLHRSKGLEWPVVYLAGVALGLLPHKRSIEYYDPEFKQHIIPESIEEERRLCYVGVTRAEDNLYISVPLTYQRSDLKASPFLSEMGFEVPVEYRQNEEATTDRIAKD